MEHVLGRSRTILVIALGVLFFTGCDRTPSAEELKTRRKTLAQFCDAPAPVAFGAPLSDNSMVGVSRSNGPDALPAHKKWRVSAGDAYRPEPLHKAKHQNPAYIVCLDDNPTVLGEKTYYVNGNSNAPKLFHRTIPKVTVTVFEAKTAKKLGTTVIEGKTKPPPFGSEFSNTIQYRAPWPFAEIRTFLAGTVAPTP